MILGFLSIERLGLSIKIQYLLQKIDTEYVIQYI